MWQGAAFCVALANCFLGLEAAGGEDLPGARFVFVAGGGERAARGAEAQEAATCSELQRVVAVKARAGALIDKGLHS